MHGDWWSIQVPVPVALAFVATMGYLISRWHQPAGNDAVIRSRRELKRAQAVASSLEKINRTVCQSLAKHYATVSKFKDRVGRLSGRQQEAAWKDLCQEAESILEPTLQLASQLAGAYDEIRQQSANLMSFTDLRTDPLTGLNNRRGLEEAMSVQLAPDGPLPFAVLPGHVRHRPLQAGQRSEGTSVRRSRLAGAFPIV